MTFSLNTLTHLDINLGDKCNQKCIMCECWLNLNPPDLPPSKLWPKVSEAISYAESECNKLDKIMIIGGEPFEHPGLADFLKEQSFGAYLTIYTNFTVPLPKSHWPSNVHFITSMDAPDDLTYRQIRRTEDFPITQNNIKENKTRIIHVDTTVSRLNISKLDQILEKTEEIGCTHWFLPIDPRIIRYARRNPYDPRADAMARRVAQALLNELDLAKVKSFFEINRENKRINDYNMFAGLFYAGIHHFADITGGMSDDQHLIANANVDRCPAGERYLEIGFDNSGNFVPILHCPELYALCENNTLARLDEMSEDTRNHNRSSSFQSYEFDITPHFERFEDLIEWLTEKYQSVGCKSFCGRTQFLGIDEYKDLFGKMMI
jgi:hypothetical protein